MSGDTKVHNAEGTCRHVEIVRGWDSVFVVYRVTQKRWTTLERQNQPKNPSYLVSYTYEETPPGRWFVQQFFLQNPSEPCNVTGDIMQTLYNVPAPTVLALWDLQQGVCSPPRLRTPRRLCCQQARFPSLGLCESRALWADIPFGGSTRPVSTQSVPADTLEIISQVMLAPPLASEPDILYGQ